MAEVTAHGKLHRQDAVARCEQRVIDGLICLAPGVRLHVCMAGAEQSAGACNGKPLERIGPLGSAVIAAARVALDGLVGEHRALGFEHRTADEILRGDELDLIRLALALALDHGSELRVRIGE